MKERIILKSILLFTLTLSAAACSTSRDSSRAYVESASEYWSSGQAELAIVQLRNAIRVEPRNIEAYLFLTKIQEAERQWQGLHNNLRRILEIDPNHRETRLKLAGMLFAAQEAEAAKPLLDAALAANPEGVDELVLAATYELDQGNTEKAEEFIAAARAADPENLDAASLLVLLHLAEEDYGSAHSVVDFISDSHGESLKVLTLRLRIFSGERDLGAMASTLSKMIEFDRENLKIRRSLATILLQTGDQEAARKVIEQATVDLPNSTEAKLLYASILAAGDVQAGFDQLRQYIRENPSEPVYRLSLGEALLSFGDTVAAENTYEELARLELTTGSAITASNRIATLALDQDNRAKAQNYIKNVLEQDGDNPDALLLSAFLDFRANRYEPAITSIRRVLRNEPSNDRALELLGRVHLSQNEVSLAEISFTSALNENSGNLIAAKQLASIYVVQNRLEEADRLLRPLAVDGKADAEVYRTLVQLELTRENWAGAQQLAGSYPGVTVRPVVEKLVNAIVLQGQGDYDEAIPAFSSLLEIPASRDAALAGLVSSYSASGQRDRAIALLQDQVQTNSADLIAIKLLAIELAEVGRHEVASTVWENGLSENEDWLEGRILYAAYLLAEGQSQKAFDQYVAAYSSSGKPEFKFRAATVAEQQGNFDLARQYYEELLPILPNSEALRNNLAMILIRTGGDIERAQQLASTLANSDHPYYLDTAGWLYFLQGDSERAAFLLERAVEIDPTIAEIRYHYGAALFRQKKFELAKRHLTAAVEAIGSSAPLGSDWSEDAAALLGQL